MPSELRHSAQRRRRVRPLGWALALLLFPSLGSADAHFPYVGWRARSLAAADELGWIFFDPERRALPTPEPERPRRRSALREPEDPAVERLMRWGAVEPRRLVRRPAP